MTDIGNDAKQHSERTNPNAKPFILCIDDNADFLQILSYLIEAFGFDLATATSAKLGLDIALANTPDIIFCDLGLPDMNGFEFAKQVRLNPALRNIPMIAISGLTDNESLGKALACGFDDTFAKPVKFADVRAALLQATENKSVH